MNVLSPRRILALCCALQTSNCAAFSLLSSVRESTTFKNAGWQALPPLTTELSATYGPKFCEECGKPNVRRVPEGDERERSCCSDPSCGFISYQNPKIVVGAVCHYQNKILLCKRAIEPCAGKWGYPQGFLELGETTREGAVRETLEESGAVVSAEDARLLAVYNLAGAQVQMVYAAPLASDEVAPGIESEDVGFFGWDEIPWDELAFPTVQWALEYARDVLPLTDDLPSDLVPQQRTKVYFDGTWSFVEDV